MRQTCCIVQTYSKGVNFGRKLTKGLRDNSRNSKSEEMLGDEWVVKWAVAAQGGIVCEADEGGYTQVISFNTKGGRKRLKSHPDGDHDSPRRG